MIATWMLYTVAVGACAALAAIALEPLTVARGGARRGVWIAALVTALVVPVLVAVRPAAVAPSIPSVGAIPSAAVATPFAFPSSATWSLDPWLTALWGAASLAMVVLIMSSAWTLRRAGRSARHTVLDGEPVALTENAGPGALCFGRPRIIIPAWLATLDDARRSLLVRHEREHVRAGDPHLLLVTLAALAAMPWNVALWFIVRRLRAALELDCDARVLASGGDVQTYGDLLLTVAAARRAPRMVAYLAFASTPSPLERRIRAMITPRPRLGAVRQLSLIAFATLAVVAACETRRPEPLAPVTDYSISDGRTTASKVPSAEKADSIRQETWTVIRDDVPVSVANGNSNDLLLMVYDAQGTLVKSGRIPAKSANGTSALDSLPFPAERIATVNVIKSDPLLPPEAKGGLIKIVLKPDTGLYMKRRDSELSEGGAIRVRGSAAPVESGPILVIVTSNDGKELYRAPLAARDASAKGDALSQVPVDRDAIATVNVVKTPEGVVPSAKEIHVTLKPGMGLRQER